MPLRRALHGTASVAVLVALAACSAHSDDAPSADAREAPAQVSAPIIGGSASTAAQDAVVLLVIEIPGLGQGQCSGTLIAPNLVLTARHCVSEIGDGGGACGANGAPLGGATTFGADFTPASLRVITGTKSPSSGALSRAPKGKKIFHPTETSICKSDVALLLLDRAVDDAVIAPIRLAARPTAGERVTAVGWGLNEKSGDASARLQRSGISVLRLGPSQATGNQRPVPGNFFEVGESICQGDSGGPALSATGAVVGITSQGGNGRGSATDPVAECVGTDTRNLLADLPSASATITAALREAGQAAWLEGQPSPRAGLAALGAPCADDAACASNVCLTDTRTCSKGCFNGGECPSGTVCRAVGVRDLCITAPVSAPGGGASPGTPVDPENPGAAPATTDGPAATAPGTTSVPPVTTTTTTGCAQAPVVSSPARSAAWLAALGVALGAMRHRRRARSPRAEKRRA